MNPKKRKFVHSKNKLQEVIEAAQILQDDSDKIKLVVDYIKQLEIEITNYRDYNWIKKENTLKFLSALNIIPKQDHPIFTECLPLTNAILVSYYEFKDKKGDPMDLIREVKVAVDQLVESTKLDIHYTHILSLLSSLERLNKVTSDKNIGELVVSGAISSLLNIICTIQGHSQNGDKQRDIILDDNLPTIHVRSDGTIFAECSDTPYLLREDKSFDEKKDWENDDTDAFKLILSMKSDLRKKIYNETFVTKEDKLRYSKILGLNFLKDSAHLFLLELDLVEENQQIIPYYYLSHKSYSTKHPDELICMWHIILNFSVEHVPKMRVRGKNFLPTQGTPLKNLVKLEKVASSVLSTVSKTKHPQTKLNKKVISCYENKEENRYTYTVLSKTFLKKVTDPEMEVIVGLAQMDNYSPYLPKILNIYSNFVELEILECLPTILTEEEIMYLTVDISKALFFLHSNHIIHRDVKPTNIMRRMFKNHDIYQFVLIDFGLSFSFYKQDNNCLDKSTNGVVTDNAGTGYFKAPEVNLENSYDEKIDIYSLGASIVYLMLRLHKLNRSEAWSTDVESLKWQNIQLKELVIRMLSSNPSDRPAAEEIVKLIDN